MKKRFAKVYLEITNICNLRCDFCPGNLRPPHSITPQEFETLADKLRPYTDYLYFHVMGEPLLHPRLGEFLSVAGEYGFRVSVTTNGVLLKTEGEILLKSAAVLHKVSVSLHSKEGNGERVDQDDYLSDAVEFSKKAADRGIYSVLRLWNLDTDTHKGENVENKEIEARLHEAFPEEWTPRLNGYRLSRNVFLEYAGIFTWPSESEADEIEDGYCHGLLDQIAVLADGTVVPCCLDAEGEISLGNLFFTPLEEILASPRATEMREGLMKGRFTESLCKKCTYRRRFKR